MVKEMDTMSDLQGLMLAKLISVIEGSFQCSGTVGWASGRASGL